MTIPIIKTCRVVTAFGLVNAPGPILRGAIIRIFVTLKLSGVLQIFYELMQEGITNCVLSEVRLLCGPFWRSLLCCCYLINRLDFSLVDWNFNLIGNEF